MNSLFVLENLSNGGAQRVIATLFPRLDSDLRSSLVLLKSQKSYPLQPKDGQELLELKASRILFALPKLCWLLLRRRPKLVFSSIFFTDIVVYVLASIFASRSKLVFRSCNYFSEAYPNTQCVSARMLLRAYRHSKLIVCSTEAMRRDFIAHDSRLEKNIVVIPNPVDITELVHRAMGAVSHPWLMDDDLVVFVSVAKLKAQKNIALLLRAFSLVNNPKARLLILGKGPELDELKTLSDSLDIRERVCFLGFVENPYPVVRAADVFVLSSDYEGFPNALVEAMALGTAVISTDCPSGPVEIIDHQRDGILVPVRDEQVLSEAMLELLEDENKRLMLASNALLKVQQFQADHIAERLSKALLRVLES